MKKFLAVCLSAALAASMLVGCGGKNEKVTAKVIDIDLTNEEYAFGVDKEQPELLDEVNDFIASIKEGGTLDEICNKYFSDGEPEAVKSAKLDTTKDQLVIATNAAFEPFEYTKGEDYYGIDMEIASLLAEKLGKELVAKGEKSAEAVKKVITEEIEKEPLAKIDYVEVVDFDTITPTETIGKSVLVAIAVYIGKTRLIDNFIVEA